MRRRGSQSSCGAGSWRRQPRANRIATMRTAATKGMNTGVDGASSVNVLGGLPADERRMLERTAKRRRLRANDFVYTQSDAAEHFYIVESGRVRVFYQTPAGREPTATYRDPGDLFGISALAGRSTERNQAGALQRAAAVLIADRGPQGLSATRPTGTRKTCAR